MLRIALCEDSQKEMDEARAMLERYAKEHPEQSVQARYFRTGVSFLECLAGGECFDVALLDIMMPGMDGMEAARQLRERGDKTPVVFLTSSADYALEAFGVQARQYLLKPVKAEALFPVLDEVSEPRKAEAPEASFVVQAQKSKVRLQYSAILCVESFRRTLLFHLADGQTVTSKTIRVPIDIAVAPLLEDGRFLHAHKSYIINMDHVEELTPGAFLMKNGMEIPVPRYKYADMKNQYLSYLSRSGVVMLGEEGKR